MSQAGPVIALRSPGVGALLGVDMWPRGREKHLSAELQGEHPELVATMPAWERKLPME